ncbi:hypothetical protein A3K86_18900 [Photobacterium jeanii]|uniref:Transcriptional regulator n=1 Tax=Photobacterium jeanii TaxID=858640 RepID=A0A178K2T7_9GAMM|nr:hypothetical protein [Photobacterium jeanii]OAN11043.1 hypothetical protein A3K86_18900 [Photobacterium jeanii]PST90556.1 hypothetical protein C9I91_08000 [Photobacterium jeanii]
MYVAIEHEITDAVLFRKKASEKLHHPPAGMQVVTAMFDPHEATCQCIWSVNSIDLVVDFINQEFSDCAINSYFEVDPDIAIG